MNCRPVKATQRSKHKLSQGDLLTLILEGPDSLTITSDLEDHEAASKEGEV